MKIALVPFLLWTIMAILGRENINTITDRTKQDRQIARAVREISSYVLICLMINKKGIKYKAG